MHKLVHRERGPIAAAPPPPPALLVYARAARSSARPLVRPGRRGFTGSTSG